MKFAEKFISINGEGKNAGELAVFLRFSGCNLRCSYCDTMWVNEENCEVFDYTLSEIIEYIRNSGAKHVTITGGEPLLQENVEILFEAIHSLNINVEIETNGSVDLSKFIQNTPFVSFTMDYKMPSSLMEQHMFLENLSILRKTDTLKLVCGSNEDLSKILEIIPLASKDVPIFISPSFTEIEPCEIVDFIIKNKLSRVKMQLQMHKFIWSPEERGV